MVKSAELVFRLLVHPSKAQRTKLDLQSLSDDGRAEEAPLK
jgi:hypothetical protein